MIINHKYKFIFIRTRKTAGTSTEIALSQFCDTHDIITLLEPEDELIRQELGFPGPQNYRLGLKQYYRLVKSKHYHKLDWLKFIIRREQIRFRFRRHATAAFIKNSIPDEIWNSYFKFSFERNPFDKAISRYYWSMRRENYPPPIEDFLNSLEVQILSNWENYTINDQIVVDFVGRYENLDEDLAKIQRKLGLPAELKLPWAKGHYRKNRDHYSRFLSLEARNRIEIVCAKEIAAFKYRWIESKGNKED